MIKYYNKKMMNAGFMLASANKKLQLKINMARLNK